MNKLVTQEDVKRFIRDNLTYVNRTAGEIEWTTDDGNNMETGYYRDVYAGIHEAIIKKREIAGEKLQHHGDSNE